MHKFIGLLIVPVMFVLCLLWTSAASASVFEEGACTARPMVQGKAGEWVTTCELTRVASKVTTTAKHPAVRASKPRTGRTVVVARLGYRAPVKVASMQAGACAAGTVACLDKGRALACCAWY